MPRIWVVVLKVDYMVHEVCGRNLHTGIHIGFVTNRRLLLSSSDAVGRVMYSYKGETTTAFCTLGC